MSKEFNSMYSGLIQAVRILNESKVLGKGMDVSQENTEAVESLLENIRVKLAELKN